LNDRVLPFFEEQGRRAVAGVDRPGDRVLRKPRTP
jgi:hypothetical protein